MFRRFKATYEIGHNIRLIIRKKQAGGISTVIVKAGVLCHALGRSSQIILLILDYRVYIAPLTTDSSMNGK